MRRRTRIAISVLSGVAAAVIALLYVTAIRDEAAREQRKTMERYGGDVVSVCVATRDIEPGEVLDEGNVALEEWVSGLLPEGAMTSVRDAVGKTATSRIPKRAVLNPAYLERKESSTKVPRGRVAVSVASDAEHAVGGALERGEVVDVYVSGDALADRLVQAQVIDTSALADNGGELKWVTLAVSPERVREVLAAASRGTITLVKPGAADAERGKDESGK